MRPVDIIIVGAGDRGTSYAAFAQHHPERVRIVGVAEPRDWHRADFQKRYDVPEENVATDWKILADRPKFADAVVIATQDSLHVEPAVAFADKGYAMLLEKPMAPTADECRTIVEAVKKANILFAVCHVLRYTPYTRALKKLLDQGVIGDLVSIQHLEPVGYWHQAHSFVRGNWRNEKTSSFMLLAKSCHDLDWMRYIMGARCKNVSSFGSLKHFRKEEQPAGAAARCLDCAIEPNCPYSAQKIYMGLLEKGSTGWPLSVLTPEPTEDSVHQALREGPYGRCVYECDNDVVDHQVVTMDFEGDRSGCFTMTAFNGGGHRQTRLFGTRGELSGNGSSIEYLDFLTDQRTTVEMESSDASIMGGHGGGDYGVMDSFIRAVADNNPDEILSGPDETLESHLMVFAAEKARLENQVVRVTDA